jgi:hypothetical protein
MKHLILLAFLSVGFYMVSNVTGQEVSKQSRIQEKFPANAELAWQNSHKSYVEELELYAKEHPKEGILDVDKDIKKPEDIIKFAELIGNAASLGVEAYSSSEITKLYGNKMVKWECKVALIEVIGNGTGPHPVKLNLDTEEDSVTALDFLHVYLELPEYDKWRIKGLKSGMRIAFTGRIVGVLFADLEQDKHYSIFTMVRDTTILNITEK